MNTLKVSFFLVVLVFIFCVASNGQSYNLKKIVTPTEVDCLVKTIDHLHESSQRYRKYLSAQTLDDQIIEQMDSVYETAGIEVWFKYKKSLHLALPKEVEDSLWQLQHQVDLENLLTLRGIIETYGYLPESLIGDNEYVQLILLMHPPMSWDPRVFFDDYSRLLFPEVKAGRMSPKDYAQFYDDIKVKILREKQLYGTVQEFDPHSNTVLPATIEDIAISNKAREEIGLPLLKEGEYRL